MAILGGSLRGKTWEYSEGNEPLSLTQLQKSLSFLESEWSEHSLPVETRVSDILLQNDRDQETLFPTVPEEEIPTMLKPGIPGVTDVIKHLQELNQDQ